MTKRTYTRAYTVEFGKILGRHGLGKYLTPTQQAALVQELVTAAKGISDGETSQRGTAHALATYEDTTNRLIDLLHDVCGIAPNWRAKSNYDKLLELKGRGADEPKLTHYMKWWRQTYRGKDRFPPTLDDLLTFWPSAVQWQGDSLTTEQPAPHLQAYYDRVTERELELERRRNAY